jgi:hypothetical protein
MAVQHLGWETSGIEKAVRAGVAARVKGVDSAAGYPFISDDKDQTRPEQEWSEVTLVQGRGSNTEVTGERSATVGKKQWRHGLITIPGGAFRTFNTVLYSIGQRIFLRQLAV